MAEIVLASVGKLTELTIDPILCQFKYMFCYKSKIETLKGKVNGVNGLKTKERELQQLVGEKKRNGKTIKPGVIDLLDKVDKLKEQAERILESETNSKMQCLFLTCPNLKTRYSLGRKAAKKTAEVAELLKEFTYERVDEPEIGELTHYRNPGDFGSFETRISIKKEIMEALKDKDVKIIGICGMAGVGKTTMAKEIRNQVEVDKLFEQVVMAVVSQDQGVTKIQDKLAEALGLEIKEKNNEIVRAERLCNRLGADAEKSVLVILDDVWECIELGNIGIPLSCGDKSLKVLLTSRFEDVCNDMGAQKKFKVVVLNSEESWKLFKEKAKISDNATDVIKCTAEKVARECGGLPLALVTIARALSTKTEDVWKNALIELQNSIVTNIRGVQEVLYSRIELSYNYLESNEAKSLLLLCSLFPEDFSIGIEDLVRYAWGLKFFRGTETLSATRRRVNSIVDNLKSCYMLLLVENKANVKLHDVVRDVCLRIASKEKHAYLSKHGLKKWTKHDYNEPYDKIFLALHEQMNQLPSGLEYPNLKLLSVWCEKQSLNIPKEFFADMKDLRVLDFSWMKIQIPSSIPLLTNLRTLCLDYCTLKSDISTIGNLKNLEVLSFRGSNLDHYPDDIAELINLMSLDLRSEHSCPLPRGILVKLKKLEELYMGIVEIRDDELKQRVYIVQEISSLTDLKAFQISTNDPQFLLQILHVLCIEKLERFHIELTDLKYARENIMENYYFRSGLHISSITDASMLSQPIINSLIWRADHLSTVMRRADHLSLQVLEKMNMSDEVGFEYLNGIHPTRAFYRLKVIDLGGMPRLQEIDLHRFSNFKRFRFASKIDQVAIYDSVEKMGSGVYILFYFECAKDDAEISLFSQLTSLDMISLPKLVHITRMFPKGNYIFEKLTRLQVSGCENLSYLFSPSIASSLVALKDLWVSHCEALEEIIGGQEEDNTSNIEIVDEGSTSRIVFPELRDLSLCYLDRFRLLSSQNYEFVFPSLKSLQIIKCPVMTKFCSRLCAPMLDEVCFVDISNFMDSKGLVHIREDDKFFDTSNIVEDTGAIDGLLAFERERLQKITLRGIPRMKYLWRGVIKPSGSLHKLTILKIKYCPSVKSLFSEPVALCLVNLQSISISNCEMLEEIVSIDTEQNEVTQTLEFPKLQNISLCSLRNFKSFRFGSKWLVGVHNPLFKQVTLPNLEQLIIGKLGCTVKILEELRQIRFHKLKKLKVKSFDDLSILFDFEYTKDEAEISILSQLTSLRVESLPKLVHITRMFPPGIHIFENLTELDVSECDNLSYLFSPSVASSLVALDYLWVSYCGALEEIIGRQEGDTLNIEIAEDGTPSRIEFPKLINLTLMHLDRFRLLSFQNYELVFPSLESLQIINCPVMTKFCSRQSAPKLIKVLINSEPTVDVSNIIDSEGWIHIQEDGIFVDTSNFVEDTAMSN